MDHSPPGSCPWNYPSKYTGCHFLQGILLTQGLNLQLLWLLRWLADSSPLSHLGSPIPIVQMMKLILRKVVLAKGYTGEAAPLEAGVGKVVVLSSTEGQEPSAEKHAACQLLQEGQSKDGS